ncbi:hypothetical protein DQ384_06115 [Sphaerisporangium album]|uniref:Uncharacterized protein n=1 Tax=Sphaerisporangium album TaxID=509200 RepID=A0A367FPC5_9ACTN|nr:hypothetical protein DQ384_06115 [Sphaerisporangium album]
MSTSTDIPVQVWWFNESVKAETFFEVDLPTLGRHLPVGILLSVGAHWSRGRQMVELVCVQAGRSPEAPAK